MKTAAIKVEKSTWKRLNSLKEPGDTFDDVIQRLLEEHEDEEDPNA